MGAAPAHFDDAAAGRKPRRCGQPIERGEHARIRRLVDAAAGLADEKHDRLVRTMAVRAGDKGVSALEAVGKTLFEQEIQCPIDGDRREALAGTRCQRVGDVVGAERAMGAEQRAQHRPANGSEAQARTPAGRFGIRERTGRGVGAVARMVAAAGLAMGMSLAARRRVAGPVVVVARLSGGAMAVRIRVGRCLMPAARAGVKFRSQPGDKTGVTPCPALF